MLRINFEIAHSFAASPDGFGLEAGDVLPELMERWELHWAEQSLNNQERRARVIKKQLEELRTMLDRIVEEVPSLLHELKVLEEIIDYKKGEKESLAAMQLVDDERKEHERLQRLQSAKDKLALKDGRRRWRHQAPAPAPAPGPAPGPANAAADPMVAFRQQIQAEMKQMFQQFAGAVPFAPVPPTAPPSQAPVPPTAPPATATMEDLFHGVNEQQFHQFMAAAAAAAAPSVSVVPPQRQGSPKRPREDEHLDYDEEPDDGEELGEWGSPEDLADAAQIAGENRRDGRARRRRTRRPLRPTAAGHPDRRQRIVVDDEPQLDEKHDVPMPPPPVEPPVVISVAAAPPSEDEVKRADMEEAEKKADQRRKEFERVDAVAKAAEALKIARDINQQFSPKKSLADRVKAVLPWN